MRYSIRFLLFSYLAALTLFVLFLSGWMLYQQRELSELQQVEDFTEQIESVTSDLVYLAAEQNFLVNARTSGQWDERIRSLHLLLDRSPASLRSTIRYTALKVSFQKADEHKKQLMSVHNPRLQERYLLLLMTHTRQASTDLRALRQLVKQQSNEISATHTYYTLISFAGLLAFSLLLVMLVWYRVKRPISRLVEGLNRFENGELAAQIPDAEIKELQNIVDAGNAMAQSLSALTVSRDELLAEVERRKSVEAKLHQREEEIRAEHQQRLTERERMIQLEKLSALGTMVGGVAHEINNPLMGVMNFVEYARDKATDEKSIVTLGLALEQIERMRRIVRNMLVFVSADSMQLARGNLQLAVNQTLALLEGEFKKHRIQVKLDLPQEARMVKCSEGTLQQVLLNLLINARDAMAGQQEQCLSLSWEECDGKGKLFVCDNGPGVKPEIIEKIFDPFFTTKPAGQGTGLGLSVSRRLLQEVGAEISIANHREGNFCMVSFLQNS